MRNTYQQNLIAAALVGALASLASIACADDTVATPTSTSATTPAAAPVMEPGAAPEEEPWQIGVTVPLWAPQINGNVTVLGHQQDVNVSFDQLRDHLDASFALGRNRTQC